MCSHILLSPFHPWRSGFWGGAWHKPKKRRTKPALWGAGGAWWFGVLILQHDADGTTLAVFPGGQDCLSVQEGWS